MQNAVLRWGNPTDYSTPKIADYISTKRMDLQTVCFVLNVYRFAMGYGCCCLDELNNPAMRAVFAYIPRGTN